jgi:hypothetical protein
MLTIGTGALRATILDPVKDRDRFGTRYCTGGYIFQVNDSGKGDLLSGPTFPESFNTFDGQGIPDAFNQAPLRDAKLVGPEALILGIGVCDLVENKVKDFCLWNVKKGAEAVDMATIHSFQGYEVELRRHVGIMGRTIRSRTTVLNRSKAMIPINWFPHPFFPQPKGEELCAFNLGLSMPENPGYVLGANGFINRRGAPPEKGAFQALFHDSRAPLSVLQRHDALGLIAATCDYVPDAFPIWGNGRTFSWEPYFQWNIFAGSEATWTVDYHF